MYDVTVLGYHAGRAQWPLARTYLPEVARSIAIYNTRSVAGNDTLIPARNNGAGRVGSAGVASPTTTDSQIQRPGPITSRPHSLPSEQPLTPKLQIRLSICKILFQFAKSE